MSRLSAVAVAAIVAVGSSGVGCSSMSTVRVQGDTVYAGPHLRPVAILHAQVTSAYLLFFAIPGHVSLDQVVNRMLLVAAKELGADKVVQVTVDITPDTGIWVLRKLLGWRTAEASGIAVMVDPEPADAPAPVPPAP